MKRLLPALMVLMLAMLVAAGGCRRAGEPLPAKEGIDTESDAQKGLVAVGGQHDDNRLAADDPEKEEDDPETDPDENRVQEPIGNLLPTQNVGGHTGRIVDLFFDPAGKRLYTAGPPGEVAEWDVPSGERLRLWRFPRPVNRMAMFPDGKRLAVAADDANHPGKAARTAIWTIDLDKGEVRLRKVLDGRDCKALAVAPKADRLAIALDRNIEVFALEGKLSRVLGKTVAVRSLRFDPFGRWLIGASQKPTDYWGKVRAWESSLKSPGKGKKGKQGDALLSGAIKFPRATWSGDGKYAVGIGGGHEPTLAVWKFNNAPRTKVDRKLGADRLRAPGEVKVYYYPIDAVPLTDDEILAAWHRHDSSLKLVRVDLKNDRVEMLPASILLQSQHTTRMAVSADGRWLAVTTDPAFQVALYDLKNKKEVRRLGLNIRVPRMVAWSATGYGIAWGYRRRPPGKEGLVAATEGLDLERMQPLSRKALAAVRPAARLKKGSIHRGEKGRFYFVHNGNKVRIDVRGVSRGTGRVYKDEAGKERLIVVHDSGRKVSIVDCETGKVVAPVGAGYSRVYNLEVSPDQKYVLVAGGGMELEVLALARPKKPLLRLMAGRGAWVAWTEQGYYAGTPGGEKLFGWKVVAAPDRLAAFHPASRFRKQLYRPDLIEQVLAKGSVEAALKHLRQGEAAKVDELLPPTVVIDVDKSKLPEVTVTVTARPSGPKQPVQSLRLLLNGRPLPEEKYQVDLGKDGKAECRRSWTLKVPEGKYELSVLARSPDSLSVSEAKEVSYKQPPTSRLFALCVGVDKYANAQINLNAAGNDAKAIAAALKKHCGKPLFASADAKPLLNANATKKGVLDALADLRAGKKGGEPIKPTDLVVLFFAGHGVKEKGNFYLLPHDADLKNLPKSCISGDDLRKALSRFPCQVLLLLDACQSGAAGRALGSKFRPATDDLTRTMTAEDVGVVVLAAAMGDESALEKNNRGYFARALEEAIKREPGVKGMPVPCNFRDKHIYVHHLFTYAFDRVKDSATISSIRR